MYESCLSIYLNCVCFYHFLSHYIEFQRCLPDLYTVPVIIASKAQIRFESSNSQSEFASSLYGRKQVIFLCSQQLRFLGITHHKNFPDFNAFVALIFVLLRGYLKGQGVLISAMPSLGEKVICRYPGFTCQTFV